MPWNSFEKNLDLAKRGDEGAWRHLFTLVSGRVVAFLVARGTRDVDGVAGDVFLDVVRSIRRFRGGESDFVAWTLTIAHRRMVDARRVQARRRDIATDPEDLEHQDDGDVVEDALGLIGAQRVRRLLDQLTPDQADVLALRIYGDLTMPMIAERLGKPLSAVKALQRRGLEALRRLLDES